MTNERDDRDARLDAAIKAELPPLQAPDTLRARVKDAIAREAGRRRFPLRSLALAATLVIALGAWLLWPAAPATFTHADRAREVARAYERLPAGPAVIVVPLHDLEASVQIFPRATGTIAVFNWDEAGETGPAQATSVGTHHLLYWKHRGVEFWVVGDDADDVARFVGELRAQVG